MNQSKRTRYPYRSHVNLKNLRIDASISQDELGYLTGIAQSRLSRAERGYLLLSDIERAAVAKALGVSLSALDERREAVD